MDPQLLALVVHDLKNAMGGLEGRLETLSQHTPSTAAAHTAAQVALADCRQLRQRFVQFLTLYGGDSRLQAHAEDESPHALLERAGSDCQRAHPGLTVRTLAADQAPAFWYLDPRLVRMALDAALHNAARFARQHITLQALTSGPYLVLRVDDDGPGLEAPDSRTPGPAALGTGLGTALCEAVARAHRHGPLAGHCELTNRPEGGARFELWLA